MYTSKDEKQLLEDEDKTDEKRKCKSKCVVKMSTFRDIETQEFSHFPLVRRLMDLTHKSGIK